MKLVRGGVYLVKYGYTTDPARITRIFESRRDGLIIQFKLPFWTIFGRWVIWWYGPFELTEFEFVARLSVEMKEAEVKGSKCAS